MKKVFTYAGSFSVVAVVLIFAFSSPVPSESVKDTMPAAVTISQDVTEPEEAEIEVPEPVVLPEFHYIEIVDGCGPYYNVGTCVNVRSGPGVEFSVAVRLRTGVVFRVEEDTIEGADGSEWYKIIFDKELRYPERVNGDWYVAVEPDAVRPFTDIGDQRVVMGVTASTTKRIVVSLGEEMLYAYDGDVLFMKEPVSPGLELTPTPRGEFTVFYKTPSRYMQGPIWEVSDQYYDLPGVPWNLYFTPEGAVIHGAYWHDHFGSRWSHGCVNLFSENAKKLYYWADAGTPVTVRD